MKNDWARWLFSVMFVCQNLHFGPPLEPPRAFFCIFVIFSLLFVYYAQLVRDHT